MFFVWVSSTLYVFPSSSSSSRIKVLGEPWPLKKLSTNIPNLEAFQQNIFYSVVLPAPCPTPKLEDQSVRVYLGHHL
jgi:hypothetical protein